MVRIHTIQQTITLDPWTYRLPDIPEKHPDDMTSFKHLTYNGNVHRLSIHVEELEQEGTTIVSGELYICAAPGAPFRYPDLLVAFNVDRYLYESNNGYVVSHQGKPPDFALEIASPSTGHIDVGEKVDFYAGLGVGEYWRFDEIGKSHGTRLAGDRLVDGRYMPIAVDKLPNGELRGYSDALGLYLCWREGELDWFDPVAEDYLPSLESERHLRQEERRLRLEERRLRLEERRLRQEERRLRLDAEDRIRELEERLRRWEE